MAVRMFIICVRTTLRAVSRSSGAVGLGIGGRVGSPGIGESVGSVRDGRVGRGPRVGRVGRVGSTGTYGAVGMGSGGMTCRGALSTSMSRRSTAVSPTLTSIGVARAVPSMAATAKIAVKAFIVVVSGNDCFELMLFEAWPKYVRKTSKLRVECAGSNYCEGTMMMRRISPRGISWHLNTRLVCKFLPNLPLMVMTSDVLKSGQLLIVESSIPPNTDSGLVIHNC